MTTPKTFLITCPTGRQGGSTTRLLLAAGHRVHAFVRDPTAPAALLLQEAGASLVKGSYDDPVSIAAAFTNQNITGVFLNTFPSWTDPNHEINTAKAFVSAALAAGTVKSFVISTVYKANALPDFSVLADTYPMLATYYTSKSGAENVVRTAGFESYTILRPCWLMHNFELPGPGYHFPEWSQRKISVSYPKDSKMPHLDGVDVGKFAAPALTGEAIYRNKEIDLVGQYLSWDEVAQKLGETAGVPVQLHYRSDEETAALKKAGTLPTIDAQLWNPALEEIDVEQLAKEYGVKLGTFDQYLEREKASIKKSLGVGN